MVLAVLAASQTPASAEPIPVDTTWPAHTEPVLDLAFSPDGKRLATVGDDGKLKLWDVAGRKEIGSLGDVIENANQARFTPDDRVVMALGRGDSLKRLDTATGKELPPIALKSVPGGTTAFDVSPDGKSLAVVGRGSLRILSIADGSEIKNWEVHPLYGIAAVAFSRDGKFVATAAADRKANVMEPTTGKILQTLDIKMKGQAAVFSGDSKRLFVASSDGSLRSFDVASGKGNAFTTNAPALSLAPSPDGTLLYVATGGHGPLRLATGTNDPDVNSLKCDALIKTVAVSPDGKLVAGGANDGTVSLWKIPTN